MRTSASSARREQQAARVSRTSQAQRSRQGRRNRADNRAPLIVAALAVLAIAALAAGCMAQRCTTGNDARASSPVAFATETALARKPQTLTYAAVGDIVCHKEMIAHARDDATGTYDFSAVFAPVADRLAAFDLTSVTQETPLVTNEDQVGGYPIFGTPTAMGDAIVDAGFDVVTSATNHSMDQGIDGIFETIAYWKANHPDTVLMGLHDNPDEANGVTFVERNGIRIALTDCTYGLNGFVLPEGSEYAVDMLDDLDSIIENVERAQSEADLTICYVHMGNEYATVPSDEQREVAERLIDAGADVVLGSHVHVVQPMEEVTTAAGNTGIVYYSLGNFASNQADVENMLGGLAVLDIVKVPDGNGSARTYVMSHDYIPLFCHYDYERTQMYFLDDYTDELAAGHFITLYGNPFTVDEVWSIWHDITGR